MASGRMLRAQISISTQVSRLSLKAAFLFTWIIPHLDDWGRITADVEKLKALVVPRRDEIKIKDIKSALTEMEDHFLIVLYTANGESYLQFEQFEKHQTGLHKRTPSKIPDPKAASDKDSGKFPEIPGNSRPREEKRTEEKRREEKHILSGKPDIASDFSDQKTEQLRQKAQWRTEAIEVLNFLNAKAGRAYRPKDATLRPIMARLADGATLKQCRQVIAKKHHEWKDKEGMAEYLRPKTLFNATNFEQYVGELVIVEEESDVR